MVCGDLKIFIFLISMKTLILKINTLKSEIENKVNQRIQEFSKHINSSSDQIFNELCFCILTANYSAEGGIRIQEAIGNGFLEFNEEELANKLKELGHRFPNNRANYIVEARERKEELVEKLKELKEKELREWIVKNIKGLGFKEASHFLRNIGLQDYAIIDFHIIDLLVREKIIEKPKSLTPKKYLEIEKIILNLAKETNLTLSELDLYLWYIETGKILK
jgi:N-glycosylase/DNA lyase